jgi:hypothetical protein
MFNETVLVEVHGQYSLHYATAVDAFSELLGGALLIRAKRQPLVRPRLKKRPVPPAKLLTSANDLLISGFGPDQPPPVGASIASQGRQPAESGQKPTVDRSVSAFTAAVRLASFHMTWGFDESVPDRGD